MQTGIHVHTLLSEKEFKDSFHELGYDRSFGSRVFTLLAREGNGPRTAESITFHEVNREGELEWAISIPNLSRISSELSDIRQLGSMGVQATFELIEKYSSAP